MDPRLQHHPLPILTYMAEAHAPGGLPSQLPSIPMSAMSSSLSEGGLPGAVSDADIDKHMIAKGLARLPEPHTDADLDLLWRTLATEYPHRTIGGWQTHFSANREEVMRILKIIIENPSVSNAHYSFSEEELLVNFYAAGGPSSSSSSPLSWKSFAIEVSYQNPGRTHDAWRMYGKRNRQRLEGRIQARRQEFRDRGIPIIDEGAIRSRPRSSQPDRAGPSSGSPTAHHPGTRGPYTSRRSSGGQSASQIADDDGYSDDDDEDRDAGSRRRGKGQRGGRRSSSGLLSPRQATTIEAAGSGGARRRSAKRHLDHQDDADHRESGSESESGALYGAQPMDHRSLFTFDDRVALVQLLSQCGPNPSPSDLLHFGAKHTQHSLEDWLRLCDEERDQLLQEAELIRPAPTQHQQHHQHHQQQQQQIPSLPPDDMIDPEFRQQEREYQKKYQQHVEAQMAPQPQLRQQNDGQVYVHPGSTQPQPNGSNET